MSGAPAINATREVLRRPGRQGTWERARWQRAVRGVDGQEVTTTSRLCGHVKQADGSVLRVSPTDAELLAAIQTLRAPHQIPCTPSQERIPEAERGRRLMFESSGVLCTEDGRRLQVHLGVGSTWGRVGVDRLRFRCESWEWTDGQDPSEKVRLSTLHTDLDRILDVASEKLMQMTRCPDLWVEGNGYTRLTRLSYSRSLAALLAHQTGVALPRMYGGVYPTPEIAP